MILRPAIRQKFHVEHVPGEGHFLLSETGSFVLTGPLMEAVVPMIDGRRSSGEIAALLRPGIAEGDVFSTLELLERDGHIQESDSTLPPQIAAFWSELNVDTRQVAPLLANLSAQVLALDDIDPAPLTQALEFFGLRVRDEGNIVLVLVDDYLDPRLRQINDECLAKGLPWLLVKPSGINTWVGPLFVPDRTACWQCLASRLRGNREVESYIERRKGVAGPFPVARARAWPLAVQACASAAVQTLRWLVTGSNPALESKILVIESLALGFTYHHVLKRPQCEACGEPSLAHVGGRPLLLRDRPKSSNQDGGHRSEAPEVTFERYRHHVSPISGVVKGLYPAIGHGLGPLRVFLAGHNFALKNDTLYFLQDGLRTHSSGKGMSEAQARTSALCEALERYSGLFRQEEERLTASLAELGDAALHPNDCMLYSDTQYREREQWLARRSRFQIVPLPFDESAEMEWSPVYSYTQGQTRYLPTSYLYYGYPFPEDRFYCWADSNGSAAGATIEEAILQGFFELIERDAVAIWWYNRIRRPKVALESFEDPYIDELTRFYASRGREFWVLDLTCDTGIPAFAAVNRRLDGPCEDIILGFGAHLDGRIAVMRALTEMNQFVPAVLDVMPDGRTRYAFDDHEALSWWQSATADNQPYLRPLADGAETTADQLPSFGGQSIVAEVTGCFSIVERMGMEVLLLDQTRPDVGLSVVKVIVPGLRHFWARYAPGRLYDVPVKLGWLPRPRSESELNPIPMFL